MVEKHPRAQQVLRQDIEQLQAVQVKLHSGGAMSMIEEFKPDSFDIVFVDPPFDSNLQALVLERLEKIGCVRRGGFVYVESPATKPVSPPANWRVWRDQQLGEVRMQLFRRQTMEDERNFPEPGSD
jgi:16S rRNA (guanine966-N2)-methyltransferase